MENAAKETLPCTMKGDQHRKKGIPGWTEYVKPFSGESRFWYNIRASVGKPQTGELFAIMKCKKNQYKFAVRRLKRCTDMINNDRFIQSLLNTDSSIFTEVNKLRKKPICLSSRIDSKTSPVEIATHFSEIYK